MAPLASTTEDLAGLDADALVLAVVPGEPSAALAEPTLLPRKARTHLETVLTALEADGCIGWCQRVVGVPGIAASTVVLAGIGPAASEEELRTAAATAVRSVRNKKRIALALPTPTVADLAAVADGAASGRYAYDPATTPEGAPKAPADLIVRRPEDLDAPAVDEALRRADVVARNRDLARDLINLPPNVLTPAVFAETLRRRATAAKPKVGITVLDENDLAKGGFGGLLGVGLGSVNPPRMVTLTWKPRGAQGHVALVGKGVTYDSGGLNLKPQDGLMHMKTDMAGAAAVAATVLAAAELKLPVRVTAVLPLAENMPSGTAQRPGDVVTMRGGTTVEIRNTDAEGRLILADAIALACEQEPEALLDIATLTGAAANAFGPRIAPVMGRDDAFRDRVVALGGAAGEPAWPMPLPEHLRPVLDSQVADVSHYANAKGGMLTAALFLREFVADGISWAHLDIAGPAYNDKEAEGTAPKGATGYGVGTLLAVLESYAAQSSSD